MKSLSACERSSSTGWSRFTPGSSCCRRLCTSQLQSWIGSSRSGLPSVWLQTPVWPSPPPPVPQVQPVSRKKLQLVGVTAMLVACKYEEMYAPEVADFAYITDNAFTKAQILEMEQVVLRSLKFQLGRPLPLHFLRRASKVANVSLCEFAAAVHGTVFQRCCSRSFTGIDVQKMSW